VALAGTVGRLRVIVLDASAPGLWPDLDQEDRAGAGDDNVVDDPFRRIDVVDDVIRLPQAVEQQSDLISRARMPTGFRVIVAVAMGEI
jgi:hypothetical protein